MQLGLHTGVVGRWPSRFYACAHESEPGGPAGCRRLRGRARGHEQWNAPRRRTAQGSIQDVLVNFQ